MSLPQDSVLAGMFARRLYFLCLVAQGSPTLCNPMDYRLPRSSVHGILQARILEGVAISFSRIMCVLSLITQSCPALCDRMDCSPPSSPVHGILQARIHEWVAIPFLRGSSQPNPMGSEPRSPTLQADSLPPEPLGKSHQDYDICEI